MFLEWSFRVEGYGVVGVCVFRVSRLEFCCLICRALNMSVQDLGGDQRLREVWVSSYLKLIECFLTCKSS